MIRAFVVVALLAGACGERKAPSSPAERGLAALEQRTDFNGAALHARSGHRNAQQPGDRQFVVNGFRVARTLAAEPPGNAG